MYSVQVYTEQIRKKNFEEVDEMWIEGIWEMLYFSIEVTRRWWNGETTIVQSDHREICFLSKT